MREERKNCTGSEEMTILVFVTPNPSIPVLSDAEQVFALEFDGCRAAPVQRRLRGRWRTPDVAAGGPMAGWKSYLPGAIFPRAV